MIVSAATALSANGEGNCVTTNTTILMLRLGGTASHTDTHVLEVKCGKMSVNITASVDMACQWERDLIVGSYNPFYSIIDCIIQ